MNVADRSSSPPCGIKQDLCKVRLPQVKLTSAAFLAPVLADFLQLQFPSLGSVQVVPRSGTPSSLTQLRLWPAWRLHLPFQGSR